MSRLTRRPAASDLRRPGFPLRRATLGTTIGIAAALLVGCASATAISGSDVGAAASTTPSSPSTNPGSVDPSGSGTDAPGISSVAHAGTHWKIGFDLAPTKVVVVNHPNRVVCGARSKRCGSTVTFRQPAKCVTLRSVWSDPAVTTKSRIGSACVASGKSSEQ